MEEQCHETFSFQLMFSLFSKAFLDLFFPVKTQVKFEEKTRQEIFKEEKTNGRLTVNWHKEERNEQTVNRQTFGLNI